MSAAIYFNGSTWLNIGSPLNVLGPVGDFTLEMFAYFLADNQDQTLWDARPTDTNGAYIRLSRTTGNVIALYVNTAARITGTVTLTKNTWHHIALTRSSGTTRLFINGTQDGSWADSTVYLNPTDRPRIGARGTDTSFDRMNGYISNIRFIDGTALYTSNFTKPNQPLTVSFNTVLLLANDNPIYDTTIKDNSGAYNITINRSSTNVSLVPTGPFNPGNIGEAIIASEDFNSEINNHNQFAWSNSKAGFIYS